MAQELIVSDQTTQYQRAWYRATIKEFIAASPTEVLGRMAAVNPFVLQQTQRDAWLVQTSILQVQLKELSGAIFLEYSILELPRFRGRICVGLTSGYPQAVGA